MPRLSDPWIIGGILLAASWVDACAIAPHHVIVSPTISGRVHRDGKPVENAMVFLEALREDTCSFRSDVSTRTDQNGVFHFEVRREHSFRILLPLASLYRFQVCIVDGHARHQGWYERKLKGEEGTLVLDCNVQSPLPVYYETPSGKVMGICRIGPPAAVK